MAGIKLYDYQLEALSRMHNGCILCGTVGSGKSRTAIAYYYLVNGGEINAKRYIPMSDNPPKDLYIITTARKRDTCEWQGDLAPFLLSPDPKACYYRCKVIIDSWNNIKKYADVTNAFFIFDEQRVVGNGIWVKSFLKITKENRWILLSATPGDTWSDYIPVFIANGFYKNRTEFCRDHVIYSRFTKYPKVDRYINTGRLIRLRNCILVDMDFHRKTKAHHANILCNYDRELYKKVSKTYWDPFKNEPIENASSRCYVWRRIVNSDISRSERLMELFAEHPKMIVFYNFNYERDILYNIGQTLNERGEDAVSIAEWSGYAHQPIPTTSKWLYLVQYTAGCEGWNCIETDTIVFFSQNYSWKVVEQASGRINRLNTPFTDLYYFHFISKAPIDLAISQALKSKKMFNERRFVGKLIGKGDTK